MSESSEPAESSSPLAPSHIRPRSNRLTNRQLTQLGELRALGLSVRAISDKTGITQGTIKRVFDQPSIQELLKREELEALSDWKKARKYAAKKGSHLPAKDWLLHAGSIQPVTAETGTHISINVGVVLNDGSINHNQGVTITPSKSST